METVSFKLPKELNQWLEAIASKEERSKSFLVRKALEQYLEDAEDYRDALEVLARKEPTIPLDEIERKYGLDD